jgi:hypothetical protein
MAAIATSFSAAAAAVARRRSPARLQLVALRRLPFCAAASAPPAAAASFGWADALRVASDAGVGDESDLSGYFRKVDICNRGMVSFPLAFSCRHQLHRCMYFCNALRCGLFGFVWVLQDKKGEFVEFLVEDQVVGYIHKG